MNTNTAAIESLRTFAISEVSGSTPRECADRPHFAAFAHMCTAALQGEEWAVERLMTSGFSRWTSRCSSAWTIAAIRATDCTRPDGAIARGIEI